MDRRSRVGIYVWELLVVVPVVLLILLGLIEYGLVYVNLRHLAMASRTGAKIAAEQSSFDIVAIQTEVDRHLLSSGFVSGSNEVILQHNVGSPSTTVISSASSSTATYPTTPALPDSSVIPAGCVRVTVIVPLGVLTPDLLAMFGFSVQNRSAQQTTTFAYEGS